MQVFHSICPDAQFMPLRSIEEKEDEEEEEEDERDNSDSKDEEKESSGTGGIEQSEGDKATEGNQ